MKPQRRFVDLSIYLENDVLSDPPPHRHFAARDHGRLLNAAGLTMTHVPYKESYLPDVIAQRIDVALDASTTAIGNVKGGRVRVLGITSASRVEALKDATPLGETFPGFAGESCTVSLRPGARRRRSCRRSSSTRNASSGLPTFAAR